MILHLLGLLVQIVFVFTEGIDIDAMGNVRMSVTNILKQEGHLKSEEVEEAMNAVNMLSYEGNFVDRARNMHAYVLETLKDHLQHGNKVLNIVLGSGYLISCMAHMVGITGFVVGVDDSLEHLDYIKNVITQYNPKLMKGDRIKLVDGELNSGAPEHGPYDAIYVAGASNTVPLPLKQQMKPGGRLMMVLSDANAKMRMAIVDKSSNGTLTQIEDPSLVDRMRYFPTNGEYGPMHY